MRFLLNRVSRLSVCAVLAFVLVPTLNVPTTLAGSTIKVTTTGDYTTVDGKCGLREAILAANLDKPFGSCPAGHGNDTIVVPPGAYHLTATGRDENGDLQGDLDIWTDMTIRGSAGVPTVINGDGQDRVLNVLAGRVTIDHLVITGGNTAPHDMRNTANVGGGIASFSNLTIVSSLITGNRTGEGGEGGGIFNSGMVTIRDSLISDNRADAGGGLYSTGSAYVTRTHVEGNTARGMDSHAPYVPDPTSTDTRPWGGDAAGITSQGYLSVSLSVISGNYGSNEWGHGGISMQRGVISQTTIDGNGAEVCGTGGLVIIRGQLIASTVSHNSNGNCGPAAGGVYAIDSEIINSTVSGNSSSSNWVAAGVRAERGSIVSSTITANVNSAPPNGRLAAIAGLDASGATLLRNTILEGNNGNVSGAAGIVGGDCLGRISSAGHNLFGSRTGCLTANPTDLEGVDPMLGPLANYGGPTFTHKLMPGSPAIDAWYDGSVGAGATCPAFDQRGVHRPQDGNADHVAKCDIGAFERTQ